jgi:asparagine synthase (glutamine-hydrolysing)
MCGLFGILEHRGSAVPSRALLEETARRLAHRGPDALGIHAEPGLGLVHTRLSLVDLDRRSDQPFRDESGRYTLLYNGELYESDGLRRRLARLGHRFRTTSDTEVLLLALIHLGADAVLPELEGMFAFACFDTRTRELLLARDRFGIKPLYIHDGSTAFLFGSTVRSLQPWLALRPDQGRVHSYLLGSNGPMAGRSFYEGVEMVPPGSLLRIRVGGALERAAFSCPRDLADPGLAEELARTPEHRLIDRVQEQLQASVAAQLVADAPVGAFCSGGVDSSLLMAMAARSHQNLKVFHADVTGPLSERPAAERLARHLGLELHAVPVRDQDFLDTLPDVALHFEFPVFVHPTSVPLLLVSRLARQHGVKALLSGEGSDECYLGYPWLAPNLLGKIGRTLTRFSGGKPGNQAANPLALTPADHDLIGALPGSDPVAPQEPEEPSHPSNQPSLASSAELRYILRTLLHRNDAMGMAASIEARFPFLHHALVRIAVNLPSRTKIRFSPGALDPAHLFFRDKWIIRRIAERFVPRALSHRAKRPFPTNAFQRFRIAPGFFTGSLVADWFGWRDARLGALFERGSHALRLRLFFLELWARSCLAGGGREEIAGGIRAHVSFAS